MLFSDLIYDFLVMLSKRLTEVDVSIILTVLQCKFFVFLNLLFLELVKPDSNSKIPNLGNVLTYIFTYIPMLTVIPSRHISVSIFIMFTA